MFSTTLTYGKRTVMLDGEGTPRQPNELDERYQALLDGQRLSWTEHHRFTRLLGSGGQGIVFLTERRGADRFTVPVAVKIFSPERYKSPAHYDEEMSRIAYVAARIAQIQQDNLLDVQNFIDRNRIRMMEMEWIDGYDLSQLLTIEMLHYVKRQVSTKRWNQINSVVVTQGPEQARLKPGIAIAVIRECLAALAALHREGIVHGDVKPSNIMLKRTGNAKIVDIGSACEWKNPHDNRTCTPPPMRRPRCSIAGSTPRSPIWPVWVMFWSRCSQASSRLPASTPWANCSKQSTACRIVCTRFFPRTSFATNCWSTFAEIWWLPIRHYAPPVPRKPR